ncbi:hypothetical protein [Dubosiella newyorkensis]|nr:hypothetical protein [Dubosiella newyorkensis]
MIWVVLAFRIKVMWGLNGLGSVLIPCWASLVLSVLTYSQKVTGTSRFW